MKKVMTILMAISLATVMGSCSAKNSGSPESDPYSSITVVNEVRDQKNTEEMTGSPEAESPENTDIESKAENIELEAILEDINKSFDDTIKLIENEANDVHQKLESEEEHNTYKQLISDWFSLTQNESENLFSDINEKSAEYYKRISSVIDLNDRDAAINSFDGYYKTVYDLFDEYHSTIGDLFDEMYEKYNDQISDIYWDSYYSWNDNYWNIYYDWSDTYWNTYYSWSDNYWNNYWGIDDEETFINNIPSETEPAAQQSESTSYSSENVTPELKEFLDEYEAFWDDYVEFYKKYINSITSGDYWGMLSSYAVMLEDMEEYEARLNEMEKKLDEINTDELSGADYAYYMEVTARIYVKMLEMYQPI